MALHLRYIHSNCGRWFLFWKSFTRLPSSYGEALLCQRDLPEARQQLANISEQAGPATGSVFTNNNSCEQRSHQCLGNSLHHQSDLLPRWNFYWFIYFIFSWTEINRGPMLETGKLHKGQQRNKAGTMPNAGGLGGLLHSVHIKISSSQRTSCKTHRMLLLLSGWHLIQHPNWPGRPMSQALFHCHLSSGTLPAGIHLCHLLHSLVTRSYGLHLAMPALKYRI